ncbi:MAG TPA: hypothetical protein VGF80_15850 [Galbitalea sp.]|jgi:hypothetical protein
MTTRTVPAGYRVLWLVLAIAMATAFVVWGSQLGASLRSDPDDGAAPTPVPVATAAPQIATVYSNIGPPNPATLCAEISPTPHEVTVESTTGALIATVQCTS